MLIHVSSRIAAAASCGTLAVVIAASAALGASVSTMALLFAVGIAPATALMRVAAGGRSPVPATLRARAATAGPQ